jgi:signal peptidase I
MLQRLQRLERLRMWLGLGLGLGLLWALLFLSWISPRWLVLSFFILWGVSAAGVGVYQSKLSGGRRTRNLLRKASALIAQAHSLQKAPPPKHSTKDLVMLQEHEARLIAALPTNDATVMQAALAALEADVTRFAPGVWQTITEMLTLISLAFLFALTLKTFLVEPFHIPSASMFPTLHVGDHIFVNKIIYGLRVPFVDTALFAGWRAPRRGEVIVFRHDADTDYIKRVVAIPGDVVEVTADEITLNGARLYHEYLGAQEWQELDAMTNTLETRHGNRFREQNGESFYEVLYDDPPYIMPSRRFVVPPGEYMVLGDNRDHSFDSLDWGFVPREKILGRAMFVLGSLDRGSFNWARAGVSIW